MEREVILTESKYIKSTREKETVTFLAFCFFFTLFVLPQYFGIPFPLFDFTVLRILLVVMLLIIFGDKERQQQFISLVITAPYSKVLLPYMLVTLYTLVLRVDINAFLNPFIEILTFYLLIYMIRYCLGVERTMKCVRLFSYLIVFLGIVEIIIHRSPFSYLETIHGLYTGRFFRSGHYRIMGPANHSLGYGLILLTMLPMICFDLEMKEINLLSHKLLLILIAVNVFFNGSRSTLAVFILEVVLLILFSSKAHTKKLILIGGVCFIFVLCFLVVFHNTNLGQYILMQITSVIDEVLGTTYSIQYGANMEALSSSSNYREQLKYIFQVDWLNPWLGLGRKRSFASEINGSYISSIDNYYIAEFVRYGYPGMIGYLVFLLYFLIKMLIVSVQKKSGFSKMLFVGALCYCINLLWVDSLQTLKYLYVLFAIFVCLPESIVEAEKRKTYKKPRVSRYIRE